MRIRNISFSLPLPQPEILPRISVIGEKLVNAFRSLKISISEVLHSVLSMVKNLRIKKEISPDEQSSFINRPKTYSKFIKPAKYLVLLIVASGILVGGAALVNKLTGSRSSSTDRLEVKGAKAEQLLNKEFLFPLRDEKGEKIADLKYMIEKAELRDEIIVKGQRATAVKGRTFLIFTLKITNEYKSDIELDSRDYVRLSVNGNTEEWLAPEIHNDPVQVQAISTKYSRLGFPINDTDSNLVLRVGEINGDKEEITLEINQ